MLTGVNLNVLKFGLLGVYIASLLLSREYPLISKSVQVVCIEFYSQVHFCLRWETN